MPMKSKRSILLAIMTLVVMTSSSLAQETPTIFRFYDRDKDGLISLSALPSFVRDRIAQIDVDDDGQVSIQEANEGRAAIGFGKSNSGASPPTYKNIAYSSAFERSKMDVWLPEGATGKVPLVVFFHGGGFVVGSKDAIYFNVLHSLKERGVAFASVGYPLRSDKSVKGKRASLKTIFKESATALDFIRDNADDWGVDPDRIVLAGLSAGVVISQKLAYADGEKVDAVLAIQQPFLLRPAQNWLRTDAPKMFLYTLSGPGDRLHSPRHAQQLFGQCKEVGMGCHLYGSRSSGLPRLPEGETILDVVGKELGW